MNKVERALADLDALGSVEAIRARLGAMGIRSTCASPERCAIADYLVEVLDMNVSVGTWDTAAWTGDRGYINAVVSGHTVRASHSDLIGEFIIAFDNRAFPELIEGAP